MQTDFHDLDMVRNIRDEQYRQVKDLTHKEKQAFYRLQAQKLFQALGIQITIKAGEEQVSDAMG